MMLATTPRMRIVRMRPAHQLARAADVTTRPSNAVELADLVDIIKAVDSSDVIEMELTGKKFSMTVKKQEALQAAEPVYIQAGSAPSPVPLPVAVQPAPVATATPAPAEAPAPAAVEPAKPAEVAVAGVEIAAPMSGTVYRRPAPGEPIFVKEGDKVVKGQSICIIEAMKLMNEIEAEVGGTVVKWVAEDTRPINPGEVICVIDPNA